MKGALLLILIAGLASAQFEDTDAKLADCQRDCCGRMNGSWDDSWEECSVDMADYNAYYRCRNECSEIASRDYGAMGGGAGICCAPALMLLGLAVAIARQ